jgi:dolichol-phosphate mannosyltransferase
MPTLTVLLPCLNEEQALPGLLSKLDAVASQLPAEWGLQALVVDDGSTDSTARCAQQWLGVLPVVLVQHPHNLGLGAALSSGIAWFLAHTNADEDVLGAMDADGTHPTGLLPDMLNMLYAGASPCDVVIASRYAPGGEEHGLSGLRKLYSRTASTMLSILGRVRGARDYTCGYRLYRRSILEAGKLRYGEALVTERSFVCMAELLIKLARCGARVGEVPLKLHYELKGGVSKMNVAATIRRYVLLAWRLLFDANFR